MIPFLISFLQIWYFIESLNLIKFNIWQWWLSGSSTVVDHLTPDSEIMGSKPAPDRHQKKFVEIKMSILLFFLCLHFYKLKNGYLKKSLNSIQFYIWQWWPISCSTLVEYYTSDSEMVGLNLLLGTRTNGGNKKSLLSIPYLSPFDIPKKWIFYQIFQFDSI